MDIQWTELFEGMWTGTATTGSKYSIVTTTQGWYAFEHIEGVHHKPHWSTVLPTLDEAKAACVVNAKFNQTEAHQ